VGSHLSLLSIGQVAIELFGHLLTDSPRWSDMFLFMSGSSLLWLLAGQPLLQEGRATQCCALSTVLGHMLCNQPHHHSGSLASHPALPLTGQFDGLTCPYQATGIMFSVYGVWFCLFGGGAIRPPTALDYVLWRVGGMWCSPVGVVSSHLWSWVQAGKV
jgi:hypothetical protein